MKRRNNDVKRTSITTILSDNLEILIPGAIALLLHISVLKGSFVYDDRMIISSDDVVGKRPWKEMLTRDFWGNSMSSNTSHKSYRPLTVLAFRSIHFFFGLEPFYFHLYNLVLHASCCSCYAILCRKVVALSSTTASSIDHDNSSECKKDNHETYLQKAQILVASILFAVHPIHTEAVASIVGISDIQCALFYILSILALFHSIAIDKYLTNEKQIVTTMPQHVINTKLFPYIIAILLACCSSLSKEIGVTSFGIFISYEIILIMALHHHSQGSRITLNKIIYSVYFKNPRNMARILVSFAFPTLITLGHVSLHGEKKIYSWTILENHVSLIDSKLTRILSYMNIHTMYLWKLIYPFRLSYDYGWKCFDVVESILDYKNLCTALCYSSILYLSIKSLLQKNIILFFSMCLLAIPFIPVSNLFFPVSEVDTCILSIAIFANNIYF